MDKINSSVWEKNTYQTNNHLNEVLSFQVLEVGIAEGHLENGNIWAHQQHWCTWALFRNPPGAHLLVFLLIETPIWFGLVFGLCCCTSSTGSSFCTPALTHTADVTDTHATVSLK